ncbi:MAG: signal peptidase II [Oceanococcaceae bacterium]
MPPTLKTKAVRNVSNIYGLWLSLAIIVLDQISKHWVHSNLAWYERVVVTPWLNLTHQRNTGAAFSSFSQLPPWFFVLLAVGVSLGMMIWLRRNAWGQRLVALAFCCIIGGALGNVIDRVRLGYVVDFVDFHIGNWHYAAFNVADIAISIGAALLILDMVREWRRGSAE